MGVVVSDSSAISIHLNCEESSQEREQTRKNQSCSTWLIQSEMEKSVVFDVIQSEMKKSVVFDVIQSEMKVTCT